MTLRIVRLAALSLALAACGDDPSQTLPDAPGPVEPAKLTVALSGDRLPLLQGTTGTIDVTVTRAPGVTGPVTISPVGMPAGVAFAPVTLADGQTTATLTLTADATAAHTLPTPVTIRGALGDATGDASLTVTVYGPPGSLDTSFVGGKAMIPAGAFDDYAYAAAVQADGKIVLAGRSGEHLGDFALIRLTRDGEIDATFGTGGKVLTDFSGTADVAYAVAIQPDGKIVAAGYTTVAGSAVDFAVARYLPDGSLDTTFGVGGKRTTMLGPDADTAYAIAIQPDGKILVGGDSNRTTTGLDFALVRYLPDGSLDASFGTGGSVFTPIAANGARDSIYALALQTVAGEERIVAVGGEGDFTVARYRPNGDLDASFGTGGKVANLNGSTIGAARAVAVTADNKLVIGGHSHHDFALAQLTTAGQLDGGFGTSGKVLTAVSAGNWDEIQGVAIESDGKIVVAGWVYEGNSSSGNFALARYTTAGALDPAFEDDGLVITPIATGTKPDQGTAVVLQDDPRVPATHIVVAGYASTTNSDFAVARYWR